MLVRRRFNSKEKEASGRLFFKLQLANQNLFDGTPVIYTTIACGCITFGIGPAFCAATAAVTRRAMMVTTI
jgi:hypothetical protein